MDPKPQLPPYIKDNLATAARIGLTSVSAILVKDGFLKDDQTGQFVNIGIGVVLFLATAAWAIYKNRSNSKKLVAAAATGNPTADPAAPEVKAAVAAAIDSDTSPIKAKE